MRRIWQSKSSGDFGALHKRTARWPEAGFIEQQSGKGWMSYGGGLDGAGLRRSFMWGEMHRLRNNSTPSRRNRNRFVRF